MVLGQVILAFAPSIGVAVCGRVLLGAGRRHDLHLRASAPAQLVLRSPAAHRLAVAGLARAGRADTVGRSADAPAGRGCSGRPHFSSSERVRVALAGVLLFVQQRNVTPVTSLRCPTQWHTGVGHSSLRRQPESPGRHTAGLLVALRHPVIGHRFRAAVGIPVPLDRTAATARSNASLF